MGISRMSDGMELVGVSETALALGKALTKETSNSILNYIIIITSHQLSMLVFVTSLPFLSLAPLTAFL